MAVQCVGTLIYGFDDGGGNVGGAYLVDKWDRKGNCRRSLFGFEVKNVGWDYCFSSS